MKLVGNFMLLAILMYVMSTEAAKPGKTKGMAEGQNDWKGKRLRTDENKATYARQTREQKFQPKESREPKKQEKRLSSEDTHPESFEEQLNQAVNNYKLIKQKTQRKYSEESNLGRESSIKKTSDNGVAYRKKKNSKEEEENVKETEDIYEAVSKSNKGRKSSAINKRETKEEKPLENVRVKKSKPTIVEENCPEKHVLPQTNKHKGLKKNSECEHCNSYQTLKSDYKLSKKQSKNKSEKTSKKYSEKKQDDDENIQEEDSRRTKTWKKQHRMKYEDIDDDIQTREEPNQMCRKQKHNEDNNDSEDFSEEKLMSKKKYDEEDEENQHYQEEMKYSQPKYRPTCEDRFQEEVDDNKSVSSENLVEENDNKDEEEITIEEQNMETNGRISIGKRENTVETKKGPEGLVSELYNEIDNLEPSKETKLKVLKKYMLLEMNNEGYQNEGASVPSSNIEDTLDRPNTKEELNSNLNTYMYIVEEEFKGRQIRYAVEEDNGDVRYSLSEETDGVSL